MLVVFHFYAFCPAKLELVYFCENLISNLSKILPRYTERNIPIGLKSLSADEGNLVFQSILGFLRECREDTPLPRKSCLKAPKGEKKSLPSINGFQGELLNREYVNAVQWNCWYFDINGHKVCHLYPFLWREERRPGISYDNSMNQPILEHWQRQQKRFLKVQSGEKYVIKHPSNNKLPSWGILPVIKLLLHQAYVFLVFWVHVFKQNGRSFVLRFAFTSMAFCKPLVRPRNSSMAHLRWGHLVLFWLALTKSYTPEN